MVQTGEAVNYYAGGIANLDAGKDWTLTNNASHTQQTKTAVVVAGSVCCTISAPTFVGIDPWGIAFKSTESFWRVSAKLTGSPVAE